MPLGMNFSQGLREILFPTPERGRSSVGVAKKRGLPIWGFPKIRGTILDSILGFIFGFPFLGKLPYGPLYGTIRTIGTPEAIPKFGPQSLPLLFRNGEGHDPFSILMVTPRMTPTWNPFPSQQETIHPPCNICRKNSRDYKGVRELLGF